MFHFPIGPPGIGEGGRGVLPPGHGARSIQRSRGPPRRRPQGARRPRQTGGPFPRRVVYLCFFQGRCSCYL